MQNAQAIRENEQLLRMGEIIKNIISSNFVGSESNYDVEPNTGMLIISAAPVKGNAGGNGYRIAAVSWGERIIVDLDPNGLGLLKGIFV